jgi:hypothetical protein
LPLRNGRQAGLLLAAALVARCGSAGPAGGGDARAPIEDALIAPLDLAAPADSAATVREAAAPDVVADSGERVDATVDAGELPDARDAATAPGEFACTLNASTPYHLGSEHRGYIMFGTVVDTTPGATRARVGAIRSALDTNDLLTWVWPSILTRGHTYELAVFEDHLKNRTCMGSATAEPQWLIKIPAVTGDFEFKWIQPVPHTASCPDFPAGPLP